MSRQWLRPIAFRDYLRDHADVAGEYEALKRRLGREHRLIGRRTRSRSARLSTQSQTWRWTSWKGSRLWSMQELRKVGW